MAEFTDLISVNIAPSVAKKIGVYAEDGTRVGSIDFQNRFKPFYGELLYKIGFLSDVHNETDLADENSDDLLNALTFFKNDDDVEFVCISGDLTQTSYSTNDLTVEMQKYQSNVNSANIGKPIYVTTGNHDCPSSSDVDITTFFKYAGLSDIAPSDGAEYSYEVTKTHTTKKGIEVVDHFLFLGMKRYEFTSNTYSTTDITWLANKLEEYKNDRCFVITHMFFPTYSGNFNDIYPSGNWLSGTMLTLLKALIDAYPRSIWFSGHSHWKWYLQKYQDRANIYPTSNEGRTTGWAVHIPSCASPIDSDGVSTRVSMAGQSEGAIIDVYENCIDIKGIEFKGADDTNYVHRYIPTAQYRLYTAPDVTTKEDYEEQVVAATTHTDSIFAASINNWDLNSVKGNKDDNITDDITVTTVDTDIITTIKFDATSEGFILSAEHMTSGGKMKVMWDSLTVESPEGTVLETLPSYCGWYDNELFTDSNNYSLTNNPFTSELTTIAGSNNGYYGVQFNISSSFSTNNTDISITNGIIFKFTNLKYSVVGYYGMTDTLNTVYIKPTIAPSQDDTGSSEEIETNDSIFMGSINNWDLNSVKANADDTITDDITITEDGDNIITSIKFDAISEGFIFGCQNLTSGGELQLYWDSLIIESPEGTVLETLPSYCGWYDNDQFSNSGNYSLEVNPFITSITTDAGSTNGYYGAQINISSSFSTGGSGTANEGITITDGLIFRFTNLKYIITGYKGSEDTNNTAIQQGSYSDITTTTISPTSTDTETPVEYKSALIAKVTSKSSGLGISTGQSETTTVYVKYDDILVTTADGTDITEEITSTAASSSNSYKVGMYNSNSKYQYAEPGTIITVTANTSSSEYIIPLIQASSTTTASTTNIYVQLLGLQWSLTGKDTDWHEINETTTIVNGSSWGKTNISFTWAEDFIDDPTTLTYATSYTYIETGKES